MCTRQEPVLFALSVRDNIAYGRPNEDVSDEEVIAAAKAANAHEFVEKLPQVRMVSLSGVVEAPL